MKTLKTTTKTHIKVGKVFELMRELNLEFEIIGSSIRITDLELSDEHPILSNLTLLDEELRETIHMPTMIEHKLQVFE